MSEGGDPGDAVPPPPPSETAGLSPPPKAAGLSRSQNIKLAVVQLLHVLILLYIVFTPFVAQSVVSLVLYIMIVLAIVMHWVANHHYCCLSLMESKIRGVPYEEGFLNSILKPIFGLGVNNALYYAITVGLIVVAIYRIVVLLRRKSKSHSTPSPDDVTPEDASEI